MDADLYDEFGNYIGPDLDSDDDEDDVPNVAEEEEEAPEADGAVRSNLVSFRHIIVGRSVSRI